MGHKHAGWGLNLLPKQVNPAFEQNLHMLRAQKKRHCSLYARLLFINLGLIRTYSSWSHMEWLSIDFRGFWLRLVVPMNKQSLLVQTGKKFGFTTVRRFQTEWRKESFPDSSAPREASKRCNHQGGSTPLSSCHFLPLFASQMVPSTSQLSFLHHHFKQ